MHPNRMILWSACLTLCWMAAPAAAQDAPPARHRVTAAATAASPSPSFRGLTITRPPEAPADDGDIYQDGPTRYNDIRDFSPSPYVTSGVQFPYGLDGVGGYGDDLGPSGGDDTALYDRGSVNR